MSHILWSDMYKYKTFEELVNYLRDSITDCIEQQTQNKIVFSNYEVFMENKTFFDKFYSDYKKGLIRVENKFNAVKRICKNCFIQYIKEKQDGVNIILECVKKHEYNVNRKKDENLISKFSLNYKDQSAESKLLVENYFNQLNAGQVHTDYKSNIFNKIFIKKFDNNSNNNLLENEFAVNINNDGQDEKLNCLKELKEKEEQDLKNKEIMLTSKERDLINDKEVIENFNLPPEMMNKQVGQMLENIKKQISFIHSYSDVQTEMITSIFRKADEYIIKSTNNLKIYELGVNHLINILQSLKIFTNDNQNLREAFQSEIQKLTLIQRVNTLAAHLLSMLNANINELKLNSSFFLKNNFLDSDTNNILLRSLQGVNPSMLGNIPLNFNSTFYQLNNYFNSQNTSLGTFPVNNEI